MSPTISIDYQYLDGKREAVTPTFRFFSNISIFGSAQKKLLDDWPDIVLGA